MSLLLNIDTAVESASVSLAQNGQHLYMRANEQTREHAGWIHIQIGEMIREAKVSLKDISAIAVSNGPGSYTGLRIGLSAAKGLCFALNIPLITISTLEIMAAAILNQAGKSLLTGDILLCPMIDARRMEVYTAVYDKQLHGVTDPAAVILEPGKFDQLLEKNRIIFSGNGSLKWKNLCTHTHAVFAGEVDTTAMDMAALSYVYYKQNKFADLSYTEPFYIKDFYSPVRQ